MLENLQIARKAKPTTICFWSTSISTDHRISLGSLPDRPNSLYSIPSGQICYLDREINLGMDNKTVGV